MIEFMRDFHGALLPEPVRRATGHRLLDIVKALYANGLTTFISHNIETIGAIKKSTGQRLFQIFDARFHPDAEPTETAIVVLVRDGDPIACCGSRLLRLEGSLQDDLVSGRLLYADPAMVTAGDGCVVTADLASSIQDCPIALSGGVWVHPKEARLHLVEPMMRLLHTWSIAHWYMTWLIGFADRKITARYGFDAYGYATAEPGILLDYPSLGIQVDALLLAARRQQARRLYLPNITETQ